MAIAGQYHPKANPAFNAFCARSGICASIQNKTWRKATNNFSNKVFDGIAAEEKASDAKMP
jgi:hypothetical protein